MDLQQLKKQLSKDLNKASNSKDLQDLKIKYLGKIKVEFALQELENIPAGFSFPEERKKPWGTGHAILSAKDIIQEPFVAINGDDFYGLESFKVVAEYYQNGGADFSMVAFQLDNTLSDFGSVTRGLCTLNGDKLDTVIETDGLQMSSDGMKSDRKIVLSGKEPVSMNVWGFTPDLFFYLESMFIEFLEKEGKELKIICGAPNVDINQNVVVAPVGSTLFTYQNEKIKIKKAKIRGIDSEGMIVSESEIGLSNKHKGIIEP